MKFIENYILKSGRIYCVTAVLLFTFSILSCGKGSIGYGVVLISPEPRSLQTGVLVEVLDQSAINETYSVALIGEKQQYEIDQWRIELFETRESAEAWAEGYAESVNLYARNLRDGLAIRENPDISSNRVYKMRADQEVKILEKSAVSETIGDHEGHWYKVITMDGVQGYCFDYYLKIYDVTAEVRQDEGLDLTQLNEALSRVYRPEVFRSMMDSGQIFLDRFTSDFGLFADPEARIINIYLFEKSYTFEYSEVKQSGESRYILLPADAEIILKSEDTVQMVFTEDDITYDPVFVFLEDETIQEIRESEVERRENLFTRLVENGPAYNSTAYGRINFTEGNLFTWEQLDRLVPSIIPNPEYSRGTVSFDYFISPEIESGYDGALAFRFEQAPSEPLVLLYDLENSSIRLEYVPERLIEKRIVGQRSTSPLIMAFFGR